MIEGKIKSIRSYLRKKRQLIIIEVFDIQPNVVIMADLFLDIVNISFDKIEYLVGTSIQYSYYNSGELMDNGCNCVKDYTIVKNINIEISKDLLIDISQMSSIFKKIVTLRVFYKFGKEQVVITFEDDSVLFVTVRDLLLFSKLSREQIYALEGSYIYAIYYMQGELLNSGQIAQKGGVIVKELFVRYSISLMRKLRENSSFVCFEDSISSYDDSIYDRPTYGSSGYSDGYGGYLDQDFVDDALDGEADAYWNID